MAAENIGALIPTKIPGYADAADIQAALRLYHYGSYDYDPANTSTAALVNPSIAYTLNSLQGEIDTLETSALQATIFAAKGDLLSASANDTPLILSSGSNGQFLVVNTATATGLQWTNTLASPIVSGLTLSDSSIIFEGSVADEFETTLTVANPTADRTVTIPDATTTLVGTDVSQTLTNKTLNSPIINNPTFTGQASGLEIAFGQNIIFEGTTADDNELTLSAGNPTADRTITLPDATTTLVGTDVTQTLTNKTISGSNNTLSNIGNSSLTNSSITINGNSVSLGGSTTITAANPNALTIGTGLSGTSYNGSSAVTIAIDSTVATLTGSQTLTNKTLTAPIINLSLNAQVETTFTPALSDNGKLVTLDNASAITVTVPLNTAVSYATGAQINLLQLGAGQVTVAGDSGVTVYGTPGLKFRAQYSAATLIKLDTNTWLLTGDLSA